MTSTMKTPVTIATFYVTFSDDTPNGAHKHLFYGKPSKADMKKAFEKEFEDCLLYTSPSPRDTR